MPKVKGFTPSWLFTGSSGHNIFAPTPEASKASLSSSPYATRTKKRPVAGPRRTIARRGTEIFVANGREIRWGDLVYLKEAHAQNKASTRAKRASTVGNGVASDDGADRSARGYRIIKVPISDDIKQLIMSPNESLMAVVTHHTVHICFLPDPSHLTSHDTDPVPARIHSLGPTTHVTTRSPVASVLWHPLGVNGYCLVTVTTDSVVRLWELSVTDRWSFDKPARAIDLKSLANGTSLDQDFAASTNATNTGFSPDSFEMEVAAACFGSRSSGGWSPFTLWVAMREGDVYALSPLLPEKWAPPPALVASLSVSIVAKIGAIEDDPSVSEMQKLLAQQQLAWMGDIDSQEPQLIDGPPGEPPIEVYTRPSKPGAVPRLQGPFEFIAGPESEADIDTELTDILVIGPRVEVDDLMFGEDSELDLGETDREGLSLGLVCLLSTGGQVKVCLDLEGVEAQWLPPRGKTTRSAQLLLSGYDSPSLLTFQVMDSMNPLEASPDSWPLFSADATSKYSFFVTHHAGMTFFSLTPWVFRLESEVRDAGAASGSEFRLGLLASTNGSVRDRLYTQPSADVTAPLAACTAVRDPDLGYVVLSATPYEPVVLFLELPEEEEGMISVRDDEYGEDEYTLIKQEEPATPAKGMRLENIAAVAAPEPLYAHEPRPPFQVPPTFAQDSHLPLLLERLRTSRHKMVVTQELRLSPFTLQVLTEAHRLLSEETHRLGEAASQLFLKCEDMRREMEAQVRAAAETKSRIEGISASRAGNGQGQEGSDEERIRARLARARERKGKIAERLDGLRRRAMMCGQREPSYQERAWMDEVKGLEASVLGTMAAVAAMPAPGTTSAVAGSGGVMPGKQIRKRIGEVESVAGELLADAERIVRDREGAGSGSGSESPRKGLASGKEVARGHTRNSSLSSPGPQDVRVPGEVRRAKMAQVKGALAREEAMVAAVSGRLERLQFSLQG